MNFKKANWIVSVLVVLVTLGVYLVQKPQADMKQARFNQEPGPVAPESAPKREPGRYQELGFVNLVKPNQPKDETSAVFDDPAISALWDLHKTDAAKAWKVSQGSRQIIVAIIDTGADINHEDLKNNIWTNPGETGLDKNGKDKATNDFDDDGNGFKDDIHGWNFVANNAKLIDLHGHGTHIAGIIGASGGNSKCRVGLAPKVSMMILKYYEPKTPTDNLRNTIAAIRYATKMKVILSEKSKDIGLIINYSGGGLEYSDDERQAVDAARKEGILFIAAAGNEKSNSDRLKYYPADYGLANIISVTAIDPNTEVLKSSNYGVETVDIAAPGQQIRSTLPGNACGFMTGTSQATAVVTGAAAVVMAHKGNYVAEDVKKYLLSTGDSQLSLINKTGTSRKLNLLKALTVVENDGLTGVKAGNMVSPQVFNSENALFKNSEGVTRDPTSQFSKFGKSLMDSLQKNNKNEDATKDPN
jgi:subtilisin family serine protease